MHDEVFDPPREVLEARRLAQQTLKYQPDYPGAFASALHGRAYLQDFFAWHNDHHHHSGLALFTPADVFYERVTAIAATRQATLDAAFSAHPERFPNGAPRVRLPPDKVHINPITTESISITPAPSPEAPSPVPTPSIAQSLLPMTAVTNSWP